MQRFDTILCRRLRNTTQLISVLALDVVVPRRGKPHVTPWSIKRHVESLGRVLIPKSAGDAPWPLHDCTRRHCGSEYVYCDGQKSSQYLVDIGDDAKCHKLNIIDVLVFTHQVFQSYAVVT
jgi:hypothetical protein